MFATTFKDVTGLTNIKKSEHLSLSHDSLERQKQPKIAYICSHNNKYLDFGGDRVFTPASLILVDDAVLWNLKWLDQTKFKLFRNNSFISKKLNCSSEIDAEIFSLVDHVYRNYQISTYLLCTNNKFLWVDDRYYGWDVLNTSDNKGEWERWLIKAPQSSTVESNLGKFIGTSIASAMDTTARISGNIKNNLKNEDDLEIKRVRLPRPTYGKV